MLQKDFDEECVFNEMIGQHHYNHYTSVRYTNDRRTLYLALNKHGTPRKVQVKANATMGKLSTYTRVLTQPVPVKRVEELLASRKPVGEWPAHGLRHHHVCPPHIGPPTAKHRPDRQRKCSDGKTGDGGAGRHKKTDESQGGGGGGGNAWNREDEDCKRNRCDNVSHRKVDTAGRTKKKTGASGKKAGGGAKGKGKTKKTEPSEPPAPPPPPEPVAVQAAVTTVAVQAAVTTMAAPQQQDDDADADAPVTAPSDEFLGSNEN